MLDFINTDETSNWNFGVEERPLFPEGHSQPVEGWKALVRTDTNETLHVHRNSYQILQHDDVVNSTYDSIKKSNISSDFDFDVKCIDSGKRLQIDVLFNDLVTEPAVGDHVKYRIRAYNSYDGSWAYQTTADALRLWCLNGCTTADQLSSTWKRHTSQVSTDGAADKIIRGLEVFHNQKDLWQDWMKQNVERNRAELFFKRNLVLNNTKTSDESWNKKQLENLMCQLDNEFGELGKNKWALYNCMTHWATHTTKSKSPLAVTRDREQKVAKAIKSKDFFLLDK